MSLEPTQPQVLTQKQKNEQFAFKRFVKSNVLNIEWQEITSRPEPEPDILCINQSGEKIAFELVSLTDELIAKIQAAEGKAWTKAFVTADPSVDIVKKKLQKSYLTDAIRIELLIYTDGQIITPDDAILPAILPLPNTFVHPFDKIWFMGEKLACKLWTRRD